MFIIPVEAKAAIPIKMKQPQTKGKIRQIGASFFMFFIGYWELTCAKIEWGTWGEIAAAYILGTATAISPLSTISSECILR